MSRFPPLSWLPVVLMQAACSSIGPTCVSTFSEGTPPIRPDSDVAAAKAIPTQRLALGVNVLYWIDDDQAWANAGLREALRELRVATLRYPGGEVADNFDWARNALDRPRHYPLEAAAGERGQRLDYREFLQHARELDVEDVFLVVNLEGAYLAPGTAQENVLRYARKAADWVAEVKRLGHRVTHWEVGNESYLRATSYPLTAAEYASALSVFHREMKREDREIRIGAHGPAAPDTVGFADRLTAAQRRLFRSQGETLCAGREADDCLEALRREVPGRAQGAPWWEVILREAAHAFDFAAVHRYAVARADPGAGETGFAETDRLRELRDRLEHGAGRPVDITVTEWNVPYRAEKTRFADSTASALDNLVMLGNFTAAGVSHAHLWPIRFRDNDGRALLDFEHGAPTASHRALRSAATVLSARFIGQQMLDGEVYLLHTRSDAADHLLLVNRGAREVRVAIGGEILRGEQLSGTALQERASCAGARGRAVPLPPASVTVMSVGRDRGEP